MIGHLVHSRLSGRYCLHTTSGSASLTRVQNEEGVLAIGSGPRGSGDILQITTPLRKLGAGVSSSSLVDHFLI